MRNRRHLSPFLIMCLSVWARIDALGRLTPEQSIAAFLAIPRIDAHRATL